jgi:hypothetical protein
MKGSYFGCMIVHKDSFVAIEYHVSNSPASKTSASFTHGPHLTGGTGLQHRKYNSGIDERRTENDVAGGPLSFGMMISQCKPV